MKNTDNAKLANELLQAIKQQAASEKRTRAGYRRTFGLRTISENVDVGETLSNSFVWDWENEHESDELMEGVCTTLIGTCSIYADDDEILEYIQEALEIHNRTDYIGKYLYLVAGTNYDYGDDEGEGVLFNHIVVLKKERY